MTRLRPSRIKWVKFTFNLQTHEMSDGAKFPTMICRALYDVNTTTTFSNGQTLGTPCFDKMLEFSRVKRMQFSADQPGGLTFTYKLYPRVYDSTLQAFTKPKWLDFASAASAANRHYGLIVMFDDVISGDQQIAVHLEWCLAFKQRQ